MHPDLVYATGEEKWSNLAEEVEKWHKTGRPVLVGTRSLAFNLLNAVRHQEEARIVAAAGERDRITIATNMAGPGHGHQIGPRRGRDGGTPRHRQ